VKQDRYQNDILFLFISEATITDTIYIGMTENFVFFQLEEDVVEDPQQDGAPPLFSDLL
jgi:hypothetical protein